MSYSIIGDQNLDKEDCIGKVSSGPGNGIDRAKCKTVRSCPKKVLIECGISGTETSFVTTGQTINTSLVTIDTSCFIRPVVDIRFSSQIDVLLQPYDGITPPGTSEVVLRFDLMCNADDRGDIAVGSWTYKRLLTVDDTNINSSQRLETTDTFSFNKCLFPKPCDGCIDYFIRITATKISIMGEII